MEMNRLIVAIGLGLFVAAGACNKPSEADCKKAINNIRKIKNFDPPSDAEMAAAVRTCRGNATKESVSCFMNAANAAELRECEGDIYEKMGGDETPEAAKPDTAPETDETAPPANEAGATGDAAPKAGEAAPKAGEAAPKAGEAAPKAGEAAPKAGEAAPKAGEAKAGDADKKESDE
jgi:hypothetical protein